MERFRLIESISTGLGVLSMWCARYWCRHEWVGGHCVDFHDVVQLRTSVRHSGSSSCYTRVTCGHKVPLVTGHVREIEGLESIA